MSEKTDCRKFRFKNGNITQRQSLVTTDFGISKKEKGLRNYLKKMPSYLERLVGTKTKSSSSECIFCSFKICEENKYYTTDNGEETFVSSKSHHNQLWESGIILTYNPNGWHLVSEILFPRDHTENEAMLEADIADFLEAAQCQWERHTNGLLRTSVSDSSYYHGVVMNLRLGQSISHGHVHCYTSRHAQREFDDKRIPLFSIETNSWETRAWAVPFNHPRLEFTISEIHDKKDSIIPKIGSSCGLAAKRTYEHLMETTPPMSLGWFYKPSISQFSVIIHPMQRRGTIEAFQEVQLHKFNEEEIVETFRSVLEEKITNSFKQESIDYE